MTLLLDTSVLVALERKDEAVESKIRTLAESHPGRVYISFMTFFEFIFGMEALNDREKTELIKFIWNFSVLQTTNSTAWLLSGLTYKYRKEGNPKSMSDLFIASHALEHNLTLVTTDKDFADMTELKKVIL